jgi:predicted membrane protein
MTTETIHRKKKADTWDNTEREEIDYKLIMIYSLSAVCLTGIFILKQK